MKYILSPYR